MHRQPGGLAPADPDTPVVCGARSALRCYLLVGSYTGGICLLGTFREYLRILLRPRVMLWRAAETGICVHLDGNTSLCPQRAG